MELYSFNISTGGNPWYGSLLKATDGKLYGLALGGSIGWGVIFSFDVSTSTYTDVHDFDYTHGKSPHGSLIQASNGLLYGMTSDGGTKSAGTIFSFDINTNTFNDLFNFDTLNGLDPERSLMQASDGLMYGTTFS